MRRVHGAAGVAALLIAGGVAVAGRGAIPGPALLVRTVAVGGALGRVALDERSGRAFVLDHQTNSVRVLDAVTATPLHAIAAGAYPSLVALDARRGHVFVAAWADDAVRMLDAATGIVRRVVALGQEPGPGGMALDARTGRLFVTNYGAGTVRVLDTASGRLLRTVRVGGSPRRLAVDDLLATSGLGRIVAVDLHTAALEGFFTMPVEQLSAVPLLAEAVQSRVAPNGVIVAPDLGYV